MRITEDDRAEQFTYQDGVQEQARAEFASEFEQAPHVHAMDAKTVEIPDLWHLAMALRDWGMEPASAAVLETWHLAHDLKKALAAAQSA